MGEENNVQLGVAYVFLVGYLMRSLFLTLRLPASTAVILTGFTFSSIFKVAPIASQRETLHQFVFCLVPLTAGLSIKLMDLKKHIFVMAWLPTTLELLGIAGYAFCALEYTAMESLVLGTTLVGLAYGVVMPKMMQFNKLFPGHSLCRLMFRWAPLEAAFVVFCFGNLTSFAHPARQPAGELFTVVVLVNALRIMTTLLMGAVIGVISGWAISRRTELKIKGQQVFSGERVEAFLMTLAMALISSGIGQLVNSSLIDWGLSQGSLFHPELLLIVTGSAFVHTAETSMLREVKSTFGGVWVFGQLILFSSLGSRTELSLFLSLPRVLPLILCGLVFRFLGVLVGLLLIGKTRTCNQLIPSTCFCFLSTLPRATLQGALGPVPANLGFFQGHPHQDDALVFIDVAARLYIVLMSFVGEVLLNIYGPSLLRASSAADVENESSDEEEELDSQVGERTPKVRFEDTPRRPSSLGGRPRAHLYSDGELVDPTAINDSGMLSQWQELVNPKAVFTLSAGHKQEFASCLKPSSSPCLSQQGCMDCLSRTESNPRESVSIGSDHRAIHTAGHAVHEEDVDGSLGYL